MGKENKNIGKNRKNKHCGTTGLLHKKEIPRSDLIKRERCAIKSWNEDIDNKGSEQRQHPGFVFSTAIYWRGGRTNQYWPCLPLHCRPPVQISKAELMNENFVSIKVDREEMPEVDHLYMSVCQAMTGRGGWPLTIVMSPEKEPFFAGTYFPKTGRGNRPGMLELIPSLMNAWNNKQEDIQKIKKGDFECHLTHTTYLM